jgi:hypothetical protein
MLRLLCGVGSRAPHVPGPVTDFFLSAPTLSYVLDPRRAPMLPRILGPVAGFSIISPLWRGSRDASFLGLMAGLHNLAHCPCSDTTCPCMLEQVLVRKRRLHGDGISSSSWTWPKQVLNHHTSLETCLLRRRHHQRHLHLLHLRRRSTHQANAKSINRICDIASSSSALVKMLESTSSATVTGISVSRGPTIP